MGGLSLQRAKNRYPLSSTSVSLLTHLAKILDSTAELTLFSFFTITPNMDPDWKKNEIGKKDVDTLGSDASLLE